VPIEIKPSAGRQIIESYGGGRFRVSGWTHAGSILVLPHKAMPWSVARFEDVNLETLGPVLDGSIELLLLGCGTLQQMAALDLRAGLKGRGVVVDTMDTGAACRTYNVLAAEERRVGAALIAVP
jgi:uncharacterized protein